MPLKLNSNIMKRASLLASVIFFAGAAFALAYTSPGKPQGFVNDYAETISPSVQIQLEQQLSAFSKETALQIVVVTISSLGDEVIEGYAVKLFEEWGIGGSEKDKGALLLVAMNDRQIRIEVGYGLEGTLTDAESSRIRQKIITPSFQKGDFEKGITEGVQAIIDVIKNEADYSAEPETSTASGILYFLQHYGFIIFIILASVLGSTKSWWLGGVVGGIAGITIGFIYGFLFTGIFSIIGLTILGLIVDFLFSKGGGRGGGFMGGFGGGHGGSGGRFRGIRWGNVRWWRFEREVVIYWNWKIRIVV